MPTYEYECTKCARRLEVEQRFTDDPLTTCEECGGSLRKVYSAVGVVFKGSGFYKNDSRPSPSKKESSSAKADSKTDSKSDSTAAATASPAATGEKVSSGTEKSSTPAASTSD